MQDALPRLAAAAEPVDVGAQQLARGGLARHRASRTVTPDDIAQAAARLAGRVMRTPCLHGETLSAIAGCEVRPKVESSRAPRAWSSSIPATTRR
ncbi:MAG: hypothetical protein RJA99_2711 [Pseudomonadota bacterium]|jgi:hypothetical protein